MNIENLDCPNHQFMTRNMHDLAEVIIRFKELDSVYHGNLSLYLDSASWEVFDVRRGITIIRHDFKHVRSLLEDMRLFIRDFTHLWWANTSASRGRNLDLKEAISVKHLYKVYGMDTYLFKSKHLREYIYGKYEKTNID